MRIQSALTLCFVFVANACTRPPDTLPPITGADSGVLGCTDDDACPVGQVCDNGACVIGTKNECTNNQQCQPGYRCQIAGGCDAARCGGNRCVKKTCASDSECEPSSKVCVLGQCEARVLCNHSSTCPVDRRCRDGVCRAPCVDNADCGDRRKVCVTTSGECRDRCLNDSTCPDGFICNRNLCETAECTTEEECGPNKTCSGADDHHGRCVGYTSCQTRDQCPPHSICNAIGRCEGLPTCTNDEACGPSAYCQEGYCEPTQNCTASTCPPNTTCIGERCVPAMCRGTTDCPLGQTCVLGECIPPPFNPVVTSVRIITPAGVVAPGDRYAFVALAFDQAHRVVSGVTFTWASTSTNVATIDSSGIATAGSLRGETFITASVRTASGVVTSLPVRLVNLGARPADAVRVTVLSLESGAPVAGASVTITSTGGDLARAETDASGVVLAQGLGENALHVSAFHASYDYTTVLFTRSKDLVLALRALTRPRVTGGFHGPVDLTSVHSSGVAGLSLSGASLPSPLFDASPGALFGSDDTFTVRVPNPTGGGGTIDVPLPGATTAEIAFGPVNYPLKSNYYVRARQGLRAVYCFGGRFQFDVGSLAGGAQPGDFLSAALPYFQTFDHDVASGLDVVEVPFVVDSIDIDGDRNTTERVPDFMRFLNQPLRPNVPQGLRYEALFHRAALPLRGAPNAVVIVSGALLPGIGFVPLGLDGFSSTDGATPDRLLTRIAPAHSGFEGGAYVVWAMAVQLSRGGIADDASTQMFVGDALPVAVDFTRGWLEPPEASFASTTREFQRDPQTRADIPLRITAVHESGSWQVFVPSGLGRVVLPSAPPGMQDRLSHDAAWRIDAIDLASTVHFDGLFAPGNPNTSGLAVDRATRRFSRGRMTVMNAR